MWISLFSIREWIFASAGIGSLLVASLPFSWAEEPEIQTAANPYSSYLDQDSFPGKSAFVRDSDKLEQLRVEHPSPMAERIVKPGYAVLPPPGTLGRTYLRKSWPIPKDEHPRTAIIQIDAPGVSEIEIDGLADMEGFQRLDGGRAFPPSSNSVAWNDVTHTAKRQPFQHVQMFVHTLSCGRP